MGGGRGRKETLNVYRIFWSNRRSPAAKANEKTFEVAIFFIHFENGPPCSIEKNVVYFYDPRKNMRAAKTAGIGCLTQTFQGLWHRARSTH